MYWRPVITEMDVNSDLVMPFISQILLWAILCGAVASGLDEICVTCRDIVHIQQAVSKLAYTSIYALLSKTAIMWDI